MIRVVHKNGNGFDSAIDIKGEYTHIDCTSHNPDPFWAKGVSPFHLGPVECYDGKTATCVENAWQFSKFYDSFKTANDYVEWRDKGWSNRVPQRYPMGRGAIPKFSIWRVNGKLEKLGYIDARKKIYMPIYAKLVTKTEAFKKLCDMRDHGVNIVLSDFDGYNNFTTRPKMSYNEVIHNPKRKMGHAFVIAMLLEKLVWIGDDGELKWQGNLMTPPEKQNEVAFDIFDL